MYAVKQVRAEHLLLLRQLNTNTQIGSGSAEYPSPNIYFFRAT